MSMVTEGSRYEYDGSITVIADSYEGQPLTLPMTRQSIQTEAFGLPILLMASEVIMGETEQSSFIHYLFMS